MRRTTLVYALILAVLAATAGLAYYSLRFSGRLEAERRDQTLAMMRELASEKILGIQGEIRSAELALFNQVDPNNLQGLFDVLTKSSLFSVFVLDDRLDMVPSGYYTKDEDQEELRSFFKAEVIPRLGIDVADAEAEDSVHLVIGGEDYLFSYRRIGRYIVVVQTDIILLFDQVFPQFFHVKSKSLFKLVDEHGDLVYGPDFAGISPAEIVEVPFSEGLSRWRLQVAQKESVISTEKEQDVIDFVLIGLALVVILVGITALVATVRREQRLNQMKSDFISNVSHELKTPLSIISMFGELLSLGRVKTPEKATEYAEIIRRESVRLSRLIDNVLDFAKIERGMDVYEFSDEEDFAEVVSRAVEISRPRLERAKMELSLEVEPDLPPARLDDSAVTLAVLNLIDNAIKYASEGKRIEVYLRKKNRGIELEVRDYGPGISAHEQEHVFERFYRAKSIRRRPIRGSGIGLALVKHIAEAHHGAVHVVCGEDFGCSFRLWIPVADGG